MECIVVSNPVRIINQFDLTNGNIVGHMVKWIPQSAAGMFLIPVDLIANVSSADEKMTGEYKTYCGLQGSQTPPIQNSLKFICPEHPETH